MNCSQMQMPKLRAKMRSPTLQGRLQTLNHDRVAEERRGTPLPQTKQQHLLRMSEIKP
jgi:hypothetical protein